MRTAILAVTTTALLGLGLFTASGQAPLKPHGVLSVLHAGQPVSLKDVGGRYEIGILPNGPEMLGHTVVEVEPDYVVLKDVVNVTETRIPIYSIKAVVTMKFDGGQTN